MDLKDKIKNLPFTSGVYLMKNSTGKVIYVGKAVNLRKRVQSYFRKKMVISKVDYLVEEIADLEWITTQSEAEALILEASLIKNFQPKYNVDLRDDKTYPLIEVTGDPFPGIFVVRPRTKNPASRYYGPYVNPRLIREALTFIRRIFHFRTCDPFPDKPCLDYHIGLCDAPCCGKVSRRDYAAIMRHVCQILEGDKNELFRDLQREMELLSKSRRFERAAKVRDQVYALGALYSGTKELNFYKEAEQLQRTLGLPRRPDRIEAFDISNIMGQQSVGSMVSFLNGKPDKSNYRRFRIKAVEGIDDFKMMAEVVRRRYTRLKAERRLFPDLILIDGGKGQLSAAQGELAALDLDIPLVSLAKREEEIFLPGRRKAVILPKDSLGLLLLQRIRDEAHRFAVTYHRKLRAKNVFLKTSRDQSA
ncbi:MAG: excinuclease ABC subunit UvrC [Candidatus Omnitrophota bacterium]|jgi:excinuclease ABC subunit C